MDGTVATVLVAVVGLFVLGILGIIALSKKGRIKEARMTSNELLLQLSKLMPSQFELVLSLASIPREHLSGSTAPQATRAAEVMRYVVQHDQLDQLARIVQQVDTGGGPASSAWRAIRTPAR